MLLGRRGLLFTFFTGAGVLALGSTAFACVTFIGTLNLDGHDGDTTVVGTGNQHAYCSTGRPTTAAAGHLSDSITATVSPGTCSDPDAVANHKLPQGVYEVRYNNADTYTFDGTYFVMDPGTGCFRAANAATTTLLGTFRVNGAGKGSWTGTITTAGSPVYHGVGDAGNFCIGAPTIVPDPSWSGGPPGMLAPYRLLSV